MQVKSTVKMNFPRIKQLTQAAVTALEMTAEALHTEVVQAQVMPLTQATWRRTAFLRITKIVVKGKRRWW